MTPQELKNSILQLAIQGKLVEQRPEEGTAEELYRQIQAEKQQLIKAGKIKKDKPFPEIIDDDKMFDIPEGWKWCRLGELCTLIRGITFPGTDKSREPKEGLIRCATTGSVQTNYNELADVFVPEKYIKNSLQWLEKEDIMLSTANSKELVGKSCLWIGNNKMTFGGFLTVARFPDLLCRKYLYYTIQHLHKSGIFARASTQTTNIANINNDILSKMLIALPPLAEQKRIVAKTEELLPYIDRYEQAWSKLEDFNKRFPTDMQKSILQMAIQGKLVEQRPEEGTGEELYRQIQAEKQKLIKAGKIKKEKPLPEISEDEKPFDIPETWTWVRLSNIISVLGDGIHGTPEYDENGSFYFINGNNLVNGSIKIKQDTKKVNTTQHEKYKKPLDEKTILLSINGTIGNYAFYNNEPVILGKSACYFSLIGNMSKEYICKLLNTQFFMDYAVKEATQTTIKNVSLKAMRMLPIPLPPLAEQKRIVDKLLQILPLCDMLN